MTKKMPTKILVVVSFYLNDVGHGVKCLKFIRLLGLN